MIKIFLRLQFAILLILGVLSGCVCMREDDGKLKVEQSLSLKTVQWVLHDKKQDISSIQDEDDEIMIGPGQIYLWGRFPYIFGQVTDPETGHVQLFSIFIYLNKIELDRPHNFPGHPDYLNPYADMRKFKQVSADKELYGKLLDAITPPGKYVIPQEPPILLKTSKIIWRRKRNSEQVIAYPDNKIIVKHGGIELACAYPYLIGRCSDMNKPVRYFLMNLETYKISYFPNLYLIKRKYNLELSTTEFVNFADALGRTSDGKEKLEFLRKEIENIN